MTNPNSNEELKITREVTALVHHIELNRAGWWDATVKRLILSVVWLHGGTPTPNEIQNLLQNEFKLRLKFPIILSHLDSLEAKNYLIKLPESKYRIPDAHRKDFEKQLADTEAVENAAREFFFSLVAKYCAGLDPDEVWRTFDHELLQPLLKAVGANAYRLIIGEQLVADWNLVVQFSSKFAPEFKEGLKKLVAAFLDPTKEEVRFYVSRSLHARFCVEASGLSEDILAKITNLSGKPIRFHIFVDTNFLFSLLELHENPSNEAALELQELLLSLKTNPTVELYVTPRTIEEAKSSIWAAQSRYAVIPSSQNFTQAALDLGFSGMGARFLAERKKRNSKITADDWFGPYLNSFVPIAKEKGIQLHNDSMDVYVQRQDVVDDILDVLETQRLRPPERQKTYEKIQHDMILWHAVKDRRAKYVESVLDAEYWILTVDFGLIRFDKRKQQASGQTCPICLHPTSLVQLLQFWVPKTKEFEEAILGSLRLPFLFQEFDVESERTSLRIIDGIARYEGRDSIPEEAILHVVLNEDLRHRLVPTLTEEEKQELIHEALLEEMKKREVAEKARAEELESRLRNQEQVLATMAAEKEADKVALNRIVEEERLKSEQIRSLEAGKSAQEVENAKLLARLREQETQLENVKRQEQSRRLVRKCSYVYGVLLVLSLLLSLAGGFAFVKYSPALVELFGKAPIAAFAGIFCFVLLHLVIEFYARRRGELAALYPFKVIRRFRRWLWSVVLFGFLAGVFGNLYANRIQKSIDGRSTSRAPSSDNRSSTSPTNPKSQP
jgi:hypothetical protein